jgi:CRP-like cAMP-binding protein
MINESLAFANGPVEAISLPNRPNSPEESYKAIFLNGKNRKVMNQLCNAEYAVIDGEVTFVLWGSDGKETIFNLKKGEKISISARTAYRDNGLGIMINRCHPSFDKDQVVLLEE